MALRATRAAGRRSRFAQRESSPTSSHTRTAQRKSSYEVSLGSVIASCRRRAGIATVFKTLRLGKMESTNVPVNVGRDTFRRLKTSGAAKRTLGVSLLGACTSKGCPTKSDENEDRYAHGKIYLSMDALRRGKAERAGDFMEDMTPCWAFATFDGHAGPACAQFLKDNFLVHLRKCTLMFTKQAARRRHRSCAPDGRHRSGVYRDVMDDVETSSVQSRRRSRSSTRTSDRLQKEPEDVPPQPVEVVLARLLTDTLASLTRSFEKGALSSGEISGACVIAGLYSEGALVLANIGDCQAVYHGQVKSAPGAPVTAQTTIHDATNRSEVARCLSSGGFVTSTGRFQGVLEPSRTIGDVDVKAEAPKGCIASYPELFKVDIASEVFRGDEISPVPPFLVLATDGVWDEASANTVVAEVKDGIGKIQAHKRRFAIPRKHRRNHSTGSMTFTDSESDSEDEESSEFCGSGEWAGRGMDLAERVVSLARGRYDDATALVVVFE